MHRPSTAILHLSAAIGASMIAEGVETESEAATLADLGYSMAQGYLFARPMPIEDLTLLLRADVPSAEHREPLVHSQMAGGKRLVSA
jgi:ammonium transporter, Amt family